MPIHVSWVDQAETILEFAFIGEWTVDELVVRLEEVYQIRQQSPRPVPMLVNFAESGRFPPNIVANFAKVARMPWARSDDQAYRVLYGINTLSRPFVLHFRDWFIRVPVADTREEALAMIIAWQQENDPPDD